MWCFVAIVVRWVKHCGVCGEKIEAFVAIVVRRASVGCGDFWGGVVVVV